jgi:ribosomal protein S6
MSTEKNLKDGAKIYEVGYIIVPSVPEEKIGAEVEKVRSVISKFGGEIIGGEEAKKKTLSYTMIKKIGVTNHRFKEGYFGWLKFEMSSENVNEIKKTLETDNNVLRFLLINTVRENTYLGEKAKVLAKENSKEDDEEKAEVKEETNPEEIDKSIDDMVKNAN